MVHALTKFERRNLVVNTIQLSCFISVAESLSFARTAEQLNVTQPTVTHQIQSLESELNVKLFHRSTRFVELTPEGVSFINDAKSIMAIYENAVKRFANPSRTEIITLNIGIFRFSQVKVLPYALRELANLYPNVHPNIQIIPWRQLYHFIEDDTVDIVLSIEDDRAKNSSIIYKELIKSPLVCVCRDDNRLALKETISMEELKNEKLIFHNQSYAIPALSQIQFTLSENRSPVDIHSCDSPNEAMILANAGFGMAILPEFIVPWWNGVTQMKIENSPLLSYGIYYKSNNKNDVLKNFVSIFENYINITH